MHAGIVVADGSVLFKAQATRNQTTLVRIIRLVRLAQSSKPAMGQLVERMSAVFVPVVVAIALASAALCWVVGPEPRIAYSLVVTTTVAHHCRRRPRR